jgi:hypothetical protein
MIDFVFVCIERTRKKSNSIPLLEKVEQKGLPREARQAVSPEFPLLEKVAPEGKKGSRPSGSAAFSSLFCE